MLRPQHAPARASPRAQLANASLPVSASRGAVAWCIMHGTRIAALEHRRTELRQEHGVYPHTHHTSTWGLGVFGMEVFVKLEDTSEAAGSAAGTANSSRTGCSTQRATPDCAAASVPRRATDLPTTAQGKAARTRYKQGPARPHTCVRTTTPPRMLCGECGCLLACFGVCEG